MEYGGRLARVVDDDVVDVVVVDDVGHVATASATRVLDSLLLLVLRRVRGVLLMLLLMLLLLMLMLLVMVAGRGSPTAHAETLAVTDALAFEPPLLVLALLRHRVFCQLLTAAEGPLLSLISVTVTVYEVIIFLLALIRCICLLRVI